MPIKYHCPIFSITRDSLLEGRTTHRSLLFILRDVALSGRERSARSVEERQRGARREYYNVIIDIIVTRVPSITRYLLRGYMPENEQRK